MSVNSSGKLLRLDNAHWGRYLALIILCTVLDQATKLMAEHYLIYRNAVSVMPHLNFSLAYNEGAAFSFLANGSGWQRWFLAGISIAAVVGLSVWLCRLQKDMKLLSFALAFIIAGALGNLIDRVYLGKVIDFLDFYWGRSHFPTFNFADIFINIGAGLWILHEIKLWHQEKQNS
jgi:signal peptidase II